MSKELKFKTKDYIICTINGVEQYRGCISLIKNVNGKNVYLGQMTHNKDVFEADEETLSIDKGKECIVNIYEGKEIVSSYRLIVYSRNSAITLVSRMEPLKCRYVSVIVNGVEVNSDAEFLKA